MQELEKRIGRNRVLLVAPSLQVEKTIPWERAVNLVLFRDGYVVLNREDRLLQAPNFQMPMPLVVAHGSNYFKGARIYNNRDIASKKAIRQRDNYTCQYCNSYGTTIDHIIPKALGGKSTWGNLCVACSTCNSKKGSKTLDQIGYKNPIIPNVVPWKNNPLQETLFSTLEMVVS